MDSMMGMDGSCAMGWMMGAMTLIWILVAVALVLGIAALVKYLRSGRDRLPGKGDASSRNGAEHGDHAVSAGLRSSPTASR